MTKSIQELVLQRKENLTNCAAGKPLISFGEGDAPVINYRMPQSTSFTTYGHILISVDGKCWSLKALENYKNIFEGLSEHDISKQIEGTISSITTLKALSNANMLFKEQFKGILTQNTSPNFDKTYISTSASEDSISPNTNFLAVQLKKGFIPFAITRFSGLEKILGFTKRPNKAAPKLFIIEEYKTISYLGNYGAGKTINTFTLLPGEETSILVKSFKEKTETISVSSNIVDSFSKESANEMEDLLERENATSDSSTSSNNLATTTSNSFTADIHFNIDASFKIFGIGVSGTTAGGINNINTSGTSNTISNTSARTANTKNLHKALHKHVDKSNANRTNSISQNSSTDSKESFEKTTTRNLVNPNVSRVLNFVFRDLLQEYITITYLNDIKIGFTNGHPESERLVSVEHLEILLDEILKNDKDGEFCKKNIREHISCQYDTVIDYSGVARPFLELFKEEETKQCNKGVQYFRKMPRLKYFYNTITAETLSKVEVSSNKLDEIIMFDINGIILNVDKYILKSDSVIIDALLGEASALDCFNTNVQEEKKNELVLKNLKEELALETLKEIKDPIKRSELFAEIFNPKQNIINT